MQTSLARRLSCCATLILGACFSLAVLADAPAGRYTVSDGTVYDTKTKLTWQQPVPSAQYNWTDAKSYCAGLGATLGGTGWRLPTVKELVTLIDYSRSYPAIDPTAFPSTKPATYWSATALTLSPPGVYLVENTQGLMLTAPATASVLREVRCVR